MVQQRSRQGFHRLGGGDARSIPGGAEPRAGTIFLFFSVFLGEVVNVLVVCVLMLVGLAFCSIFGFVLFLSFSSCCFPLSLVTCRQWDGVLYTITQLV